MEEEYLLLGIDLFKEYAQVCFLGQLSGTAEPESMCLISNEQGREFSDFLEELMHRVISLFPGKQLKKMVIVLEKHTEKAEEVNLALLRLGFQKDQFRIFSRMESFMYFAVSQSNQLWRNDVVLFDFTEQGLLYYRLNFDRKRSPILIAADRVDLQKVLNMSHLRLETQERLRNLLKEITEPLLSIGVISSIYVTGIGFEENWAEEVMKSWCLGRRVFFGQNLYAKGACYGAKILEEELESKYSLLEEDSIRCSLFFSAYHNTLNELIPLAMMGTHFGRAAAKAEVILDKTDELQFVVKDGIRQDTVQLLVKLDYMMSRRNKTVRLSVESFFLDRETLVLRIKDLGFGDFFPSTYRVWEQVVGL